VKAFFPGAPSPHTPHTRNSLSTVISLAEPSECNHNHWLQSAPAKSESYTLVSVVGSRASTVQLGGKGSPADGKRKVTRWLGSETTIFPGHSTLTTLSVVAPPGVGFLLRFMGLRVNSYCATSRPLTQQMSRIYPNLHAEPLMRKVKLQRQWPSTTQKTFSGRLCCF